jgi:hypothetical protein
MSQAAQQQLKDVLGISLARAATLLRETGGSIEDAISLHFAAVPLSVPRSPRCALARSSVPSGFAALPAFDVMLNVSREVWRRRSLLARVQRQRRLRQALQAK